MPTFVAALDALREHRFHERWFLSGHSWVRHARAVAEQAPRGRYAELPDSGRSPWLRELGRALRGFLGPPA